MLEACDEKEPCADYFRVIERSGRIRRNPFSNNQFRLNSILARGSEFNNRDKIAQIAEFPQLCSTASYIFPRRFNLTCSMRQILALSSWYFCLALHFSSNRDGPSRGTA